MVRGLALLQPQQRFPAVDEECLPSWNPCYPRADLALSTSNCVLFPFPLPRTFRVTDEPTCGTAKLQLSCISSLAHALSKYTLHLPFTRRGPAVLWVSSRRLCFELCKRGTGRRRPEGQSQLRRSSSESGGRGLQDWRAGTGRTAEQFLHGADDICLSMWMSSYIV